MTLATAIGHYWVRASVTTRWHYGHEYRIPGAYEFVTLCGRRFLVKTWQEREQYRPTGEVCRSCLNDLDGDR